MVEEVTQEVVSVHSSPSESPTIPSTEQPEDDDAHMEDNDSASSSSAEAVKRRPGLRLILGERSPRSHVNHLPQHPGNHSAAFLNMSYRRPRWMI